MTRSTKILHFLLFALLALLVAGFISALGADWERHGDAPLLPHGQPGEPDSQGASDPFLLKDGSLWRMWYTALDDAGAPSIACAESADGLSWTKLGAVLGSGPLGRFDVAGSYSPSVLEENGGFTIWYTGFDGKHERIGRAVSADGLVWTRTPGPGAKGSALDLGPPDRFDAQRVGGPWVLAEGAGYRMFYHGGAVGLQTRIGMAVSADGLSWERIYGSGELGAVFDKGKDSFDDSEVREPAVILEQGLYRLWYNSDHFCITRPIYLMGYATSPDALTWERHGEVMSMGPDGAWDDRDVFSPAVLFDGNEYRMYYGGHSDGDPAPGIGLASSPPYRLELAQGDHDFGEVVVAGWRSWPPEIKNSGVREITLSGLSVNDPAFRLVDPPELPLVLFTNDDPHLAVAFSPSGVSDYAGALTLTLAPPTLSPVTIPLRGSGNLVAVASDARDYTTGDLQTVTLSLSNPGPARPVDLYIALDAQGGYYFYPAFGEAPCPISFTIPAGFLLQDAELLSFPISADVPNGEYGWLAALTEQGSGALLGRVSDFRFTSTLTYQQIDVEEVKAWLDAGTVFTLLDVRTEEEYCSAHIPGAINIPADELEQRYPELDPATTLVVYGASDDQAARAAESLLALGLRYIFTMGGMANWPYETEPC